MCGISGIISERNEKEIREAFRELLLLSESRGKEASGFAIKNNGKILYYKTPFAASEMTKEGIYQKYVENYSGEGFCVIGHSRLVTDGYEHDNKNNQPVVRDGMCVIHNGIIVNSGKLWERYKKAGRETNLDTELIPVILNEEKDIITGIRRLYNETEGTITTAFYHKDYNKIFISTNTGSLYYVNDDKRKIFIFASERYILSQLINKKFTEISGDKIYKLNYGEVIVYDFAKYELEISRLINDFKEEKRGEEFEYEEIKDEEKKAVNINTSLEHSEYNPPERFVEHIEKITEKINGLKRCKKCLLPETFPYIEYDEKGVCNYCLNYKKINYNGKEELSEEVKRYRKGDGGYDCLLPFSGGRDSSYVMHFVKKELGLNPIAFSYDWGMLTDLARRNQARMCGKLNVEHILVSADIRKKRKNISLNVRAWLKRPSLGTIPLFMAGDKQYFYYTNLLLEQNKLELSILGENMLETTNFKSGFCGIKPKFGTENTYTLTKKDKIKMLSFYGKEFLLNPSYWNQSMKDTLDAFKSYYVMEHRNINLFNYIVWDEKEIMDTLISEYNWETDPETKTTWRIGDGTAAFYNYIYYTAAGFTENDTFRSNQIREGTMKREDAMEIVREENKPRWNSLKWYLDTIGLGIEETIETINKIPELYK